MAEDNVYKENRPVLKHCFCRKTDEEGYDFVECASGECKIIWFHLGCVGLDEDSIPEGGWFCPRCTSQDHWCLCGKKGRQQFILMKSFEMHSLIAKELFLNLVSDFNHPGQY